MDVLQQLNTYKAKWAYDHRLERPYAYPQSVFVEATNNCNYRCPLCPTGSSVSKRPKGFLDLKAAIRVFDEITGFIDNLVLSFYGEPLLHPQITSLVQLAHKRGLHVRMFTNLSLTPQGGWQAFLESGVDELVISIDGMSQDQYSAYRVGGQLETVLSNLEIINHIRKRQLGIPRLEIQMLALRTNEGEWSTFATRFLEWGADAVKLKSVNLGADASNTLAEAFLPQDPALHYYQENHTSTLRAGSWDREKAPGCHELYAGPAIIAWDGRYVACCRDADASIPLGSIFDRTIWDFWNGNEMAELRRRVIDPEERPDLCRQCPALLLPDFALARYSSESTADTNKKTKACSDLSPVPQSSDPMLSIPRNINNAPEVISLPEWLPARSLRPRDYTPGTLVDYGSYRVFEV